MTNHKAVFLDRDGTLNKDEEGYFHDPAQLELEPKVVPGLRLLQQHGYMLIIVSNQSGIGRGYFTAADTEAVNATLERILQEQGITITDWYYCPHTSHANCPCRKPQPQLICKAAEEHNIALQNSVIIGDKTTDIATGDAVKAAGFPAFKTALVKTGYGGTDTNYTVTPDYSGTTLQNIAEQLQPASDTDS